MCVNWCVHVLLCLSKHVLLCSKQLNVTLHTLRIHMEHGVTILSISVVEFLNVSISVWYLVCDTQ